jgi:hypothetical protein
MPAYDSLRSLAVFDEFLKVAFHRLKYRGDLGLGESLSRPLVRYYQKLEWEADMAAPVPISRERLAKRGYNQAGLIALPFALAAGLPYRPGALVRTREGYGAHGLTLVIVPTATPGFRVKATLSKLGLHTSPTGWLEFDHCKIPKAYTVGKVNLGYFYHTQNLLEERLLADDALVQSGGVLGHGEHAWLILGHRRLA